MNLSGIMSKREVDLEQYFTTPEIALSCVELVKKHYDLTKFDNIIEPSVGAGAFLEHLPIRTIAIDIDPEMKCNYLGDFLEINFSKQRSLFIGNPPFGRRSSIAFKFIEHALPSAKVIAFILPNSFHKANFINRLPTNLHQVDSLDVSGIWNGNYLNLTFFIYEKRQEEREKIVEESEHPDFTMIHKHLSRTSDEEFDRVKREYDFAMGQVANAKVKDFDSLKKKGSLFFIKTNNPYVREVFNRLDFSFLDNKNTAHKSLSRSDVIEAYKIALITLDNY